MKRLKIILILISLIGLLSCKKDKEEIAKLDVENYIQLLKSNNYESSELPAFTFQDIEALLQYTNENSIVTKFPISSTSAYKPIEPKYRLGILVLWTIESIRKPTINGMNVPGRFPSQNPFIALKNDPNQWIENHDNEAYNIILQAYLEWWETNKNKEFDQIKEIDPLENTSYSWH